MALKTVQASSNIARPGGYSFCPSSPCTKPKLPLTRPRISTGKHQKRRSPPSSSSVLKCRANLHGCVDEVARSKMDRTTEIPVVLHPSVPFPGATLRLPAFEFRYRIMMQTLLQEGTELGVVYSGKDDGGRGTTTPDVGCIVRVVECERLVDGRFFLTCVGGDRFRVTEVVRTKPYVVARVQVLRDRACSDSQPQGDVGTRARLLVQQVQRHLKNVATLSEKLNWSPRGDHHQLRRVHSAAAFSFLVARLFVDDRSEQQALLQIDDTAQRLAREGMYLERRSKYLAAIAAIKDAFQHLSCNEK